MKKIPIGIQAFSKLIEGGFVYLDKTNMIYRIANTEACYFLSRPRRFGKSLTLSTLHEYFDGQKELFVGTKMEKLETKWEKYPVFHFDFNSENYDSVESVKSLISFYLSDFEKVYGSDSNAESFEVTPIPTLFQCGFLTIIDYNKELDTYTLDIPNKEIRETTDYFSSQTRKVKEWVKE